MSNVDINVDRRTDGRTIGRLYPTLLQAGAIKTERKLVLLTNVISNRQKDCRLIQKALQHFVPGEVHNENIPI